VQKVLVAVGSHWVVPALLSAVACLWVGLVALRRPPPRWLPRVVALLLLVRFAVPVATLGTDVLARQFLAPSEAASGQALEVLRSRAESAAQPEPGGIGISNGG
jgi:hypothetical protein